MIPFKCTYKPALNVAEDSNLKYYICGYIVTPSYLSKKRPRKQYVYIFSENPNAICSHKPKKLYSAL